MVQATPTIPRPDATIHLEPTTVTAALLRDEANLQELELTIDSTTGYLTATLVGPHLDAFGHERVILRPRSAEAVALIATVTLSGYDALADAFHHIEASLSVDWSLVGHDPTVVDVAGTALLTNLDEQTITALRAVRHHPYNQLGSPRSTNPRDVALTPA
ncbi:MAG: hypothetical protein WBM50_03870 [Acidimicrobiales bacterium]